jgi:hypothetical protein
MNSLLIMSPTTFRRGGQKVRHLAVAPHLPDLRLLEPRRQVRRRYRTPDKVQRQCRSVSTGRRCYKTLFTANARQKS